MIEEQVLYPAVRTALPDGERLHEESLQEHAAVKNVLAELDKMEPSAEGYDARVRELIIGVRHHVEEEEGELFPQLQASIGTDELQDMGGKLAAAKKMAPTHPHPNAPNTPPGNIVGGAAAAVIDKARDALKRD